MSTAPGIPDVDALAAGVRAGERAALGRAITLVESTSPAHRDAAAALLAQLLPAAGAAHRVGISGVPGAGKSTFIDALGSLLTARGHRVAVLAVDPSSRRHGGSILGDKTRMARLGADPAAFVRPSPTSGTLGGVARATRQAITVVEAAGYDVVLVETVGVGQSESAVAEMTDSFLLLTVARTGDALQGIKRGVLELADVVAVNKADGEHEVESRRAARELGAALRTVHAGDQGPWRPRVLACSALTGDGVPQVWDALAEHRSVLDEGGVLAARRAEQEVAGMWAAVQDQLLALLRADPAVAALAADLEADVRAGRSNAALAAQALLATWRDRRPTRL